LEIDYNNIGFTGGESCRQYEQQRNGSDGNHGWTKLFYDADRIGQKSFIPIQTALSKLENELLGQQAEALVKGGDPALNAKLATLAKILTDLRLSQKTFYEYYKAYGGKVQAVFKSEQRLRCPEVMPPPPPPPANPPPPPSTSKPVAVNNPTLTSSPQPTTKPAPTPTPRGPWSGTFTLGTAGVRLQAVTLSVDSGLNLSGNKRYFELYNGGPNTTGLITLTNCKVSGSVMSYAGKAVCDGTGSWDGAKTSMTFSGPVTLTLNGDHLEWYQKWQNVNVTVKVKGSSYNSTVTETLYLTRQ
jgi:hypothetical protein